MAQTISLPNGSPITVVDGKYSEFWKLYQAGKWEPETAEILNTFLHRGCVYIDIGSWIGPTLLLAAQKSKIAYGIEPDPIAFSELKQNCALNPDLNRCINISEACISPRTGLLTLGSRAAGGDSMSSLLFAGQSTEWKVAGVTFDDWVRQVGALVCDFIKIDIEGGEYLVIPSMRHFLLLQRPVLLISLHPCFLEIDSTGSAKHSFRASWKRVLQTLKVLHVLRFYRFAYWPRLYRRDRPVYGWIRKFSPPSMNKLIVLLASIVSAWLARPHEVLFFDVRSKTKD